MTREYMDAVSATRWSDATIMAELADVFDSEWSGILAAAPYYRFGQRSVTTASTGLADLDDLDSGSGDSEERWFRILHVTDGTVTFPETEFARNPLATSTTNNGNAGKSYYLRGNELQILPASAVALTITVNHIPQGVADLAAGASVVVFPENSHSILAKEAASQLLMKGGAEMTAAEAWAKSAEKSRAAMLDQIRRRTMNPTRMAYPDHALDWAGG
jgi:hypothetical protein